MSSELSDLEKIPQALLENILSTLSPYTLNTMACVSKTFLGKINSKEFWDLRIRRSGLEIRKKNDYLNEADANLFAAARQGFPIVLKDYLAKANVNAKIYLSKKENIFISPIHLAALSGNVSCVQLLIAEGASFRTPDNTKYHTSPLHYAAAGGNVNCIRYFLDAGIFIDLQSTIVCPLGWNWTPLQMAARGGHAKACDLLIKRGANVSFKDPSNFQAIHRACCSESAACVKILLENKADPNAVNEDGYTPMQFAIHPKGAGAIALLLKHGVNPRKNGDFSYDFNLSFHQAISEGYYDIVKVFLDFDRSLVDARYEAPNLNMCLLGDYLTPLHYAVRSGNEDILKLLFSYYPNCTLTDQQGRTAKDFAQELGRDSMIKMLASYEVEYQQKEELYAEIDEMFNKYQMKLN